MCTGDWFRLLKEHVLCLGPEHKVERTKSESFVPPHRYLGCCREEKNDVLFREFWEINALKHECKKHPLLLL
jgi:hypothetical protein